MVADAQPVFVLTAAQFLHVAAEVLLQAVEAKANLAANVFAKALSAALASPLISSSYSIGQAGAMKANAGRFVVAKIRKGESVQREFMMGSERKNLQRLTAKTAG